MGRSVRRLRSRPTCGAARPAAVCGTTWPQSRRICASWGGSCRSVRSTWSTGPSNACWPGPPMGGAGFTPPAQRRCGEYCWRIGQEPSSRGPAGVRTPVRMSVRHGSDMRAGVRTPASMRTLSVFRVRRQYHGGRLWAAPRRRSWFWPFIGGLAVREKPLADPSWPWGQAQDRGGWHCRPARSPR